MHKKVSHIWIIVSCLLCTLMLLPASVFGQQQNQSGQKLIVTIEEVYTVDKDPVDHLWPIRHDVNEFRLVVLPHVPDREDLGQLYLYPLPNEKHLELVPGWTPLSEPLVIEMDLTSDINQVDIYYQAVDQDNNKPTFDEVIPAPSVQTLAYIWPTIKFLWKAGGTAYTGWRAIREAQNTDVYGTNVITLLRANNWNAFRGTLKDNFQEGLQIRYSVRLEGGTTPDTQGGTTPDTSGNPENNTCAQGARALALSNVVALNATYSLYLWNIIQVPNQPDQFNLDLSVRDPNQWNNGDSGWVLHSVSQVLRNTWRRVDPYPLEICVGDGNIVYYKEVTENPIGPTGNPSPNLANVSIQQAIRDYYSLIQRGDYTTANLLHKGLNLSAFENGWRQSGPAQIVYFKDIIENNDTAMAMFRLYYPNSNEVHGFRFEFKRDLVRGHERFGHWVFVRGTQLY